LNFQKEINLLWKSPLKTSI